MVKNGGVVCWYTFLTKKATVQRARSRPVFLHPPRRPLIGPFKMNRNDALLNASLGLTKASLACALAGAAGLANIGGQIFAWGHPCEELDESKLWDIKMSVAAGIFSLLPALYWQSIRANSDDTLKSRAMAFAAAATSFLSLAYALTQSLEGSKVGNVSLGLGWRATLLACAAAGIASLTTVAVPIRSTRFSPKFATAGGQVRPATQISASRDHYENFDATDGSRRSFINAAGLASVGALGVFNSPHLAHAAAADVEVPPVVTEYEFPTDWALTGTYDADAKKVLKHMKLGTTLGKGASRMEEFHKNLKSEMIEFVSYYRRFNNVSGKQSFSTLYTAINGYASHITSYGPKFPIPEKRRKRLYQEYVDIERQLKKGR